VAAVAAGLLYLLRSAGAPEIVVVDFPPVVAASGDATGAIQYRAGRDDVVGARFTAVDAANFMPVETRAPAAYGRKEGRFSFVLHTPAAQRVTLEARLVDAAGGQSRPTAFPSRSEDAGGRPRSMPRLR
jgi:hypothetical protein